MRASAARWAGTYSMMETCVPVYHDGRVIAVVTREENLSSPRLSLGFEAWTIAAADTLCQMIARGEYPYDSTPQVTAHGVPRVLDGALLLDAEGRVLQVTPNAVSCLARLGIRHDVKGKVLAQEVTDVIGEGSFIEESMAVVVMGRASWRVEIAARASTISMRALPLQNGRKRLGAVILLRDVSGFEEGLMVMVDADADLRGDGDARRLAYGDHAL